MSQQKFFLHSSSTSRLLRMKPVYAFESLIEGMMGNSRDSSHSTLSVTLLLLFKSASSLWKCFVLAVSLYFSFITLVLGDISFSNVCLYCITDAAEALELLWPLSWGSITVQSDRYHEGLLQYNLTIITRVYCSPIWPLSLWGSITAQSDHYHEGLLQYNMTIIITRVYYSIIWPLSWGAITAQSDHYHEGLLQYNMTIIMRDYCSTIQSLSWRSIAVQSNHYHEGLLQYNLIIIMRVSCSIIWPSSWGSIAVQSNHYHEGLLQYKRM